MPNSKAKSHADCLEILLSSETKIEKPNAEVIEYIESLSNISLINTQIKKEDTPILHLLFNLALWQYRYIKGGMYSIHFEKSQILFYQYLLLPEVQEILKDIPALSTFPQKEIENQITANNKYLKTAKALVDDFGLSVIVPIASMMAFVTFVGVIMCAFPPAGIILIAPVILGIAGVFLFWKQATKIPPPPTYQNLFTEAKKYKVKTYFRKEETDNEGQSLLRSISTQPPSLKHV
jgi:hypothetical protein